MDRLLHSPNNVTRHKESHEVKHIGQLISLQSSTLFESLRNIILFVMCGLDLGPELDIVTSCNPLIAQPSAGVTFYPRHQMED